MSLTNIVAFIQIVCINTFTSICEAAFGKITWTWTITFTLHFNYRLREYELVALNNEVRDIFFVSFHSFKLILKSFENG